ncbi:MAG: MFS transporter [Anaerolineae bacterium]|nr:MFS transporter [Anaerolineae bacterium]
MSHLTPHFDTPRPATPPPGAAKPPLPKAFYVGLITTFLFSISLTILAPIVPLFITDELNAPEHWIGTASLFLAISAVALRIPGGAFSDRLGRRQIMIIGAIANLVAAVLYVASHTIAMLLLARLITGVAIALFTTANKALLVDLSPPARRGEALGLGNTAFSLGLILSPLLGEGMKNAVGFQAVYVLSGVLTLLALAATLALPGGKPDRCASPGARQDVTDTLRERGTWASILLMAGLASIMTLMFTFFPLLAERKALLDDAPRIISSFSIGLGLSIWATVNSVSEPFAGWLSDRLGRQPVAIPGLLIVVIGVISLGQASTTFGTYLSVAVMAAGWGIVHTIADALSQDAVSPALRGMSAAVVYTSFDLIIGIDAQAFGILIDGSNFDPFFLVATVSTLSFSVIGILLSSRLLTYEQRATQPIQSPGD